MIFNEFYHIPRNSWPVSFDRCDGLNGKQATHRENELISIPNTRARIAASKVECVKPKQLRCSVQVLICSFHENRGTEFDRGKGLVLIWVHYCATYTPFSVRSRVRNLAVTYDHQCSQPVRTPQPRWGDPTDPPRDAATTLKKNLQHLHQSRPRGALLGHGACCIWFEPLEAACDAGYCRVDLPSRKRAIPLIRGYIEQHQIEVYKTWRGGERKGGGIARRSHNIY